ncbi:hypothetical protein ABZ570_07725 [Micromonospora sp. NPDC007271]|uniref:AfsR/SARP family transcriptional regulator n=1 Tax=Micromonospora sp. NPDC007271 TaxID=3154587 RepID=UPI0033D15ECC
MELQIRLLGPVEVFNNGQDVTPGGAKRRPVLAGLALAANRPVSLTRLAGMVWSDVPPPSAVAVIRRANPKPWQIAGLAGGGGDRFRSGW